MNKSKKVIFVILLLVSLAIIGVAIMAIWGNRGNSSPVEDDDKFTVVTSFYPMYIAALNVTDGADINLYNLSEPETGCLHDYQLTTDDMKLLSNADVFIINGLGMEAFLDDVMKQYPKLRIIKASVGIESLNEPHSNEEDEHDKEHEHEEGHEHEDPNAHVWMSVANHIKQVDNIRIGLRDANPSNASLYNENASNYISKLEQLKAKVDNSLNGKKVVLFSEAYEYLAKDFGLDVRAILDLDEEKNISAREIADTVDVVRKDQVPLIIAEKEYGEKMANAVMGETGIMSVYLDTIIRGEYDKDAYINRMNSNIDLLKEALK